MIVFDADGTLIGGESTDKESFEAAFKEAAGFALEEAFLASLQEVTARAIVHQALGAAAPERLRSCRATGPAARRPRARRPWPQPDSRSSPGEGSAKA